MSDLIKWAAAEVVDDLMEDFYPSICNVMAAGIPVSNMSAIIPEIACFDGKPKMIASFAFKAA